MTTPWIEVFKAGAQTDSKGRKKTYSREYIDQRIIGTFDSKRRRVPSVIGHPKMNHPAYGWVSALRRVGDVLEAKFAKMPKEMWKAIKSGHFPERSIALDPKGRLVHVGWLGAVPPAVEGLKGLAFKKKTKIRTLTFTKRSKSVKPKKFKKLKKKLSGLKSENAQLRKFMGGKASKKRNKKRNNRVDALVENKKITPADRDRVYEYASSLSLDSRKISLDGGKKRTMEDHYLRGLAKGNDHPIFSEFALDDTDTDTGGGGNKGGGGDLATALRIAEMAGVKPKKEDKKK